MDLEQKNVSEVAEEPSEVKTELTVNDLVSSVPAISSHGGAVPVDTEEVETSPTANRTSDESVF